MPSDVWTASKMMCSVIGPWAVCVKDGVCVCVKHGGVCIKHGVCVLNMGVCVLNMGCVC